MAKGTKLYYVAPIQSLEFVLKNGILPPGEVMKLIEKKELSEEVLGMSFGKNRSQSETPEYVSLSSTWDSTMNVAIVLAYCQRRVAVIYTISNEIRNHPQFIDEEQTKKISATHHTYEALYKGRIPPEFIESHGTF